ncbi:polycystin-1-like protein 1 [Hyperolius riggenbachi]|uniref:polycystin-1-like protein 1 n=1 Tax=Hyperolius riggenbachi TaxID=752182 RepID=UPI0035A31DAC
MEKHSDNEHLLNQTVRNEIMRNPIQPFNEITTEDQWWNWSINVLLERIYWNQLRNDLNVNNEVGAMQGNLFLIGAPVIRKFTASNASSYMVFSHFKFGHLFLTSSYDQSQKLKPKTDLQTIVDIQDNMYYHCGKIQCYSNYESIISLGRQRTEAYSTLLNIRNHKWIERNVGRSSAVALQFALYNPPTNLFTIISLLTEWSPSGCVVTSSVTESLRIYHFASLMDYFKTAFEMAFLGMTLVSFFIQLNIVIQKSIKHYLQDLWNFLEVSIIVFSLCYFVSRFYHFKLVAEFIDHLQRGFISVSINFTFITEYLKWSRRLNGIILFFMITKLMNMLRCYRIMASRIAVFYLSCSSSAAIMLKGTITSEQQCSKKVHRSKYLVTFKEVASYISGMMLSVIDRQRPKITDSISIVGSNFYFDEFEDLIDELLFRLNTISDSLHHSLPEKSYCYTEEEEGINNCDTYSTCSFTQTATEYEDAIKQGQLEVDSVT